MKSIKDTQQQFKIKLDDNLIKFTNFEEIYFPKNCILCGNNTQNRIGRDLHGTFTSRYDYKKNYYFSFPVCNNCYTNMELKSGLKSKSGKLTLISTIIGIFLSIPFYLFTLSIFLSIGIIVLSFVLPFRYYKENTKTKIKFDDFLKIQISKDDVNTVELDFKDEEYANALREINFAKLKENETNKEEKSDNVDEKKDESGPDFNDQK